MSPHEPGRPNAPGAPARYTSAPNGDSPLHANDDVDALVHRAVRMAPMPPIPAGFAAAVAQMVADHREQARAETFVTLLGVAALVVAAAMFALPGLGSALGTLLATNAGVPWPMLAAAAVTLLVVAGADGALRRLPARRAG